VGSIPTQSTINKYKRQRGLVLSKASSEKKSNQLGMNHRTASHRLVKDLLWNFIVNAGLSNCCKCGKPMTREDFSIEHVEPWLDSDNPVGKFFDIVNIGYSHQSCNFADAKGNRKYDSREEAKQAHLETARAWKRANRTYCPVERKQRYERLGT
jgi:hypothetical protein